MRVNIKKLMSGALVVLLGLLASSSLAGNKQLMSVQKAKDLARRAIVESVVGLKVRSNALWAERNSDYYKIESEVTASIKGVQFDKIQYDKSKDIAKATAHIRLGAVENIIGKQVKYNDAIITRTAFATSSPQYVPTLNALRAAELNAYDEMAKLIVGQKIESKTTVKNFILNNDRVRTRALVAIWGSEVKDYGWEGDNAFVTLRLNARWVHDVVGQVIEYTDDNYLEVTGHGSFNDDYSDIQDAEDNTTNYVHKQPAIEEATFNIPSSTELNGAPAGEIRDTQPATGGSVLHE